jgi:hypothetical protein
MSREAGSLLHRQLSDQRGVIWGEAVTAMPLPPRLLTQPRRREGRERRKRLPSHTDVGGATWLSP